MAEQARIENAINSLGRGVYIGQTAVSPDGRWVAWVEGGQGGQEIRVAPLDHADQGRQITANGAADCNENEIAWAPDSRELAFLSDCAAPGQQSDLYIAAAAGAERLPRRLTMLAGFVNAPAYSPDGKRSLSYMSKGRRGRQGRWRQRNRRRE